MNNKYRIEKIFEKLDRFDTANLSLDENNYKEFLDKYIEISNPDFVAIINMKSIVPVIFEKNFRLQFDESYDATVEGIIEAHNISNSEQLNKVFELDTELFDFISKNPETIEPKKNVYSVKVNTELIKGEGVSLRRDVIILSKDDDGFANLILSAWYDVTDMYGIKNQILLSIKDYGPNELKNRTKTIKLNEHLSKIISPIIQLTKREKQIVHLIAQGKTSEDIAMALNISLYTVNTHRQNIIKKNNVKNISAIIKDI